MTSFGEILNTLRLINKTWGLPDYLNNEDYYKRPGSVRLDEDKLCERWIQYVKEHGPKHNKKFHSKANGILRLVTYNIRFGQDRCKGPNRYNYEHILDFVKKTDPDIICLQEVPVEPHTTSYGHRIKPFFNRKPNASEYFSNKMSNLGYDFDYCFAGWKIANAIFYKRDLLYDKIKFSKWEANGTSRCMTGIRFDSISVINLHLEVSGSKRLDNVKDFRDQILKEGINRDNLIVLGDFNSVIDSSELKLFRGLGLNSVFNIVGNQPPTTSLFNKVVDHILVPASYGRNEVYQADIYLVENSDHFPVIVDLIRKNLG